MQQIAITLATIATVIAFPALAFAQPQPDAAVVNDVGLALVLGGGTAIGVVHAFAMQAWRRRKAILAIDTRAEVLSLLAFIVPLGILAYFALGQMQPGLEVGPQIIGAIWVALWTTSKMNSGPLGGAPAAKG